jgi:hypothetical protein
MFSKFKLDRNECAEIASKMSKTSKKTHKVEPDASVGLAALLKESADSFSQPKIADSETVADEEPPPHETSIDFKFDTTGPNLYQRCLTWNPNWPGTGKKPGTAKPRKEDLAIRVLKSAEIARRYVNWAAVKEKRVQKPGSNEVNPAWKGTFELLQDLMQYTFL